MPAPNIRAYVETTRVARWHWDIPMGAKAGPFPDMPAQHRDGSTFRPTAIRVRRDGRHAFVYVDGPRVKQDGKPAAVGTQSRVYELPGDALPAWVADIVADELATPIEIPDAKFRIA